MVTFILPNPVGMKQKLLLVCVLAVTTLAHAQRASIKKVELAGDRIIVHYDLEDSNPAHEYQIKLYSSQNNFNTALTKVTGDVGTEVRPGYDKKIIWSVREELGPYRGRLSLEVRGSVFLPVARINSISGGEKFRRGKSYLINWRPGNSNPVNIELLKGGKAVSAELTQPNTGAFRLEVPKHSRVGSDYSIRITDTRNAEDVAVSPSFTVKRKIPLALKALPLVAIGGALLLLKPPPPLPGPTGIPDPPDPE